jgi:hypothetical protein
MNKGKRKRDLPLDELSELQQLGRHDEVERELERQAKRFFSTPEPPDERAERRAFFEAAKRVLARDPEPDFPEAEHFSDPKCSKTKPRRGASS